MSECFSVHTVRKIYDQIKIDMKLQARVRTDAYVVCCVRALCFRAFVRVCVRACVFVFAFAT